MRTQTMAMVFLASGLAAGCSGGFAVRNDTAYRDATREVLMAKNDAIRSCYDAELKAQPDLTGRLVMHFKVQAETGKVIDPQIDPKGTSAPPSLGQCVLQVVSDATLAPADAREGHATFSWEFKPGA